MICSYQVIQDMRKMGEGCIVNIASRAGTVTAPFAAAYSTAKSGLIRATSCWQKELEIDGFGDKIHLYALHPGGVRAGMKCKCFLDAGVNAVQADGNSGSGR